MPKRESTPLSQFLRAACIMAAAGFGLGIVVFGVIADKSHPYLALEFLVIVPVVALGPVVWPWAFDCKGVPIRLRWRRAGATFIGMSVGGGIAFAIIARHWH